MCTPTSTLCKRSVKKKSCLSNYHVLIINMVLLFSYLSVQGNVILTDHEYTILNLLRTRTEGDDVRFAVREKFPFETAKKPEPLPDIEK